MKVAILDDYAGTVRTLACFPLLAAHDVTIWNDHTDDVDVLAERLRETEALVLIRERTKIERALLRRLPKLRLISQRGVFPHVDVEACTEFGIVVSSDLSAATPSYATAELTWGLVISALRFVPQEVAALKAGRWQTRVGSSLRGKTLGIYGYGRIGKVVAGYGAAFGMRVRVFGTDGTRARAEADGVAVAASREDFFATSDVVSLHLRLVDATRGLVTAADLARMSPSSLLVNTSRSGLIERGALERALAAGRPGFGAVDVYDDEPVTGTAHPLLALENAVCTPHLGYVTREEFEVQFAVIFEQIAAFADGRPANVANPDVLTHRR